jgi:hypothetical protein
MDPVFAWPFFAWIEQTPPSVFMREDFYAYFVVLIFHSLGMGLLVGAAGVVCLRAAGLAKDAPLEKFRAFFSVMWIGLALAAISGAGLLLGYPAKALTNPIFAFKFLFLAGAGWLIWRMDRKLFPLAERGEPFPGWGRGFAIGALALLVGAVAAGKLLLYTYSVLTVS